MSRSRQSRAQGRAKRTSPLISLAAVLLMALVVWAIGALGGGSDHGDAGSNGHGSGGSGSSQTIAYDALPQQAKDTIALIDAGGPYPYRQDDGTFGNREHHLPSERSGYYREYTVVTPGSSDRGARRIIAGKGGTLYYTDDHYDSFRQVQR